MVYEPLHLPKLGSLSEELIATKLESGVPKVQSPEEAKLKADERILVLNSAHVSEPATARSAADAPQPAPQPAPQHSFGSRPGSRPGSHLGSRFRSRPGSHLGSRPTSRQMAERMIRNSPTWPPRMWRDLAKMVNQAGSDKIRPGNLPGEIIAAFPSLDHRELEGRVETLLAWDRAHRSAPRTPKNKVAGGTSRLGRYV